MKKKIIEKIFNNGLEKGIDEQEWKRLTYKEQLKYVRFLESKYRENKSFEKGFQYSRNTINELGEILLGTADYYKYIYTGNIYNSDKVLIESIQQEYGRYKRSFLEKLSDYFFFEFGKKK